MKKALSLIIAVVMLLTLAACGASETEGDSGEATQAKSFSIGYIDLGSTDGTTTPLIHQLETAIAALGGTGVPVAPAEKTAEGYINALNTMIAKGVDGVVIPYVIFGEASIPTVITICEKAGVYYGLYYAAEEVSDDVTSALEGAQYYVGRCFTDEKSAAYDAMKSLSDAGCKNLGYIGLPKSNDIKDNSRDNGVNIACEEFGQTILVEQRDMTYTKTSEGGATTVENFFAAYPDMDGIVICGMSQYVLPGVMQALTSLGKTDVKVACIDFCDDMDVYANNGTLIYECGGHTDGPTYLTILMANIINGTPLYEGGVNIEEQYIKLYSAEDFNTYAEIQSEDVYNADEIAACLQLNNPDFDAAAFEEMVAAYSVSNILERHS